MKHYKSYIASVLLASVAFTACDENYDDWADPQSNEQEASIDINLQIGQASTTTFDFNSVTEESLTVINSTSLPDYEEGNTVTYMLQMAADNSFGKVVTVPLTLTASAYTALTADLNNAVIELYGRRPEARAVNVRIISHVTSGTTTVYTLSNTLELTMTPIAPEIETGYYLIGTINDWNAADVSTLAQFTHSGADVYEDPYFTLMFEITSESWWKIVPQSTYDAVVGGSISSVWDSSVLGVADNGDASLEGTLLLNGDGAAVIEGNGWVKMTLNMMEYTYTIEIIGEMPRQLYVPGGYQDWDPATAPTVYTKNLDFKYDGYINIANDSFEFKFTEEPSWDGKDYGVNDEGELVAGGGNIAVTENGFYRIAVNLNSMTYSATKTEWGLIGDATPGGWDSSTPMVQDASGYVWTVTTDLTAGEYKFRANDAWDIDLGGDLSDLSYGGANINLPTAGTYTITLDLSNPEVYSATVVQQ